MYGESYDVEKAYPREIGSYSGCSGTPAPSKGNTSLSSVSSQKLQSRLPLLPRLRRCVCRPDYKTASTRHGHGEAPGALLPTSR